MKTNYIVIEHVGATQVCCANCNALVVRPDTTPLPEMLEDLSKLCYCDDKVRLHCSAIVGVDRMQQMRA